MTVVSSTIKAATLAAAGQAGAGAISPTVAALIRSAREPSRFRQQAPSLPKKCRARPGCVALKAGAHETPSQIS
jgi:hypothetical protein